MLWWLKCKFKYSFYLQIETNYLSLKWSEKTDRNKTTNVIYITPYKNLRLYLLKNENKYFKNETSLNSLLILISSPVLLKNLSMFSGL